MSFWGELQRRKVVRATLAYLAAAFVAAQVAQLLSDALGLPSTLLTIVVIVEIALLPLVIAAAWAFDWSSQGVHQTDSAAPPLRWRRIAPAALATIVLLAAGLFYAMRSPEVELDSNLVAVLPFRVSGSDDIAFLREGMMDLLSAKLTGEGGPRAADPRSMMSALKASDHDANSISEEDARTVALSLGAGYVLLGSAVGTPAQLTVNATLTDVRTGKKVTVERTGSADTLAAFIDHFTAELLSIRAGEGRRLAALTSTSLPALRAYLAAQSDYRASRFENAMRNFRRALELDSTFALAAMGHILSTGWGVAPDTTENRSRRLLVHFAPRLGELDRMMANALVGDGTRTRSVRDQIAAWETVITNAPDRPEGWFLYGDVMFHYGGLAGIQDNRTVATRAFAKSLQLDSAHTPALIHLLDDALMNHDRATARHLDSVRVAHGSELSTHQVRGRQLLIGDSAGSARNRVSMDTMDTNHLFGIALTPLIYGVGLREGLQAIDRINEGTGLASERAGAYEFTHGLLLAFGLPKRAAEIAERRMSVNPRERHVVEAVVIMDALYANGDTSFARNVAARMKQRRATATDETAARDCAVEQWNLWLGEPTRAPAAAQALRQAAKAGGQDGLSALLCAHLLEALHASFHDPANARARVTALDGFLSVGPRADERLVNVANLATARLWERLGDRDAAYRAITRQGLHPAYLHYNAAMIQEQARLAALVGKNDEAVRLYRSHLQLQEMAEPSQKPHLDIVRRELSRLTDANN